MAYHCKLKGQPFKKLLLKQKIILHLVYMQMAPPSFSLTAIALSKWQEPLSSSSAFLNFASCLCNLIPLMSGRNPESSHGQNLKPQILLQSSKSKPQCRPSSPLPLTVTSNSLSQSTTITWLGHPSTFHHLLPYRPSPYLLTTFLSLLRTVLTSPTLSPSPPTKTQLTS